MSDTARVLNAMLDYYAGDIRRVNHFLKVFGFAKAIGEAEGLDARLQEILEIAALTHDIGIKLSEVKYNSAAGKYQETEGPPEARALLSPLGLNDEIIERVCHLISRHHTYDEIDGQDLQILIEADFLVNAHEDKLSENAIRAMRKRVFKTVSGIKRLDKLYLGG